MPELPEVETVKETLKSRIIGEKIVSVDVYYESMIDEVCRGDFKELLIGEEITNILRYGKYLFFIFNNVSLISHLRMEGKYFIKDICDERNLHEHIVFTFESGKTLRYHDTRKFGTMKLVRTTSFNEIMNEPELKKLGKEANDESIVKALIDSLNYHRETQDGEKILLYVDTLKNLGVNMPNIALEYAVAYAYMGNFDKGIQILKDSINTSTKPQLLYNELGSIYWTKGDTTSAIIAYKQAIECNPNYARPYINLAELYKCKNEKELAINHYFEAIQLFAQNGYYEEMGNFAAEILDIDSTNIEANKFLQYYWYKEKDYKTALAIGLEIDHLAIEQNKLEEGYANMYFMGMILFAMGVLLNYFVIFPFAFRFLSTYQVQEVVVNQIALKSYISTLLVLSLLMGILFEIPIIAYFLAKLGLIDKPLLVQYRKHAIVVLAILSAVITPTADIFTLLLVTVPLYLLYELSIHIVAHTKVKE